MDFPVRKFYFSESEDFKAMDSSSHTDSNKEISATKIELMNAAKIKKRESISVSNMEKRINLLNGKIAKLNKKKRVRERKMLK